MRDSRASAADDYIEVDGARLRYRDEGRGLPVILVHGWALDLDMWQPQVAAWTTQLRLIRLDRRGFGASSGQPSLAADARDVESLLRRLNLARVAVLGMSQGARVAMRLAAGPLRERVACLVLDGAPFDGTGAGEPEVPLERYREIVKRQGIEAFREEWRSHPFVQLRSSDPATHELLARMTARYPANDLLAPARASALEQPPSVNAIVVPTLVINGANDTPRRRSMGEELARALPNAERTLVPDAGHLPNLDNPADYNRRVLAFIARHTAAS
jgi:pimeloyl-ACP methyl ester carboxylesterase